jgi:hypothetical protein
MDWQYGVQVMLEKLFYYGAGIWMLRRAGVRWAWAIACLVMLLAVIEAIQTHIPGRVPESTDPILGAMAGIGLRALKRRPMGYHSNS